KHPVYGPMVLRAVGMHFPTHFALAEVNFDKVFPVLDSHFTSSFVGSVMGGNCASTRVPIRHSPVAAMAAAPNRPGTILPLLFCCSCRFRLFRLPPWFPPIRHPIARSADGVNPEKGEKASSTRRVIVILFRIDSLEEILSVFAMGSCVVTPRSS